MRSKNAKENKMDPKKILILDYSVSRFEASAIKRWMPNDADVKSLFIDTEESFLGDLIEEDFTHVIHSGSELSVTEDAPFTQKAIAFIEEIRNRGIPQMGICYGHQLVCRALMGKHAVRKSPKGFEVGWVNVKFNERAMNLFGIKASEVVWHHHFDEVTELPEGSELLATNDHTEIQSFINTEQNLFGTQFHPELDKVTGDKFFMVDRKLLEKNNYNVEEIVQVSPSFDAGRVLFDFFLSMSPKKALP